MSIAEARARRKQREEEQRAKDAAGSGLENPLAKIALGAGLGYLTGGLLPALTGGTTTIAAAGPVTASGVGATATVPGMSALGSTLAPSASTVIPAFEGAISGAKAGSPIEAALAGIEKGAGPTIEKNKLGLAKKTMESAGFKPASITKDGITGYSPEMYSFKTTKNTTGKTSPAVSLGRLSKAGATAFSIAQSQLDKGTDMTLISNAISGATDIPASEKPIILKGLKAKKKREL